MPVVSRRPPYLSVRCIRCDTPKVTKHENRSNTVSEDESINILFSFLYMLESLMEIKL